MLDQLINEHRIVLSIARELARSEPGEDRASWLRDLDELIAEHLEAEERFVGPLLQQYPREGIGPPLDLRAAQLGSALVAVREPGGGFGTASVTLVEAVRTHIAHLEYEVFPALGVAAQGPQLVGDGRQPDDEDARSFYDPWRR